MKPNNHSPLGRKDKIMNFFDYDFLNPDKRPPKSGWWTGWYTCNCRNCSKPFTGAKGAWTCSSCAYGFDEQLQYEKLWREFGWHYTAQHITKKLLNNQDK